MALRHKNSNKLSLRAKPILIFAASAGLIGMIIYMVSFNVSSPMKAFAASPNETMDSGSYIINTGIVPQTYNNGLKPYGMIYDLINNYNIQVKWVIDTAKTKDGKDFTFAGVDYKGGPFIIQAQFISATVKSRITYWQGQGVVGLYTIAAISVPVYSTLTSVPRMTVDDLSNNVGIIASYFTNAGIPASAYQQGPPDSLTNCHDLWINPHGDPTWATHAYLYNFAAVNGSFIWTECHATSMIEGCKNTVSPFQQLNFLTTNGLKCYSNNKCGPAITETHAGNPVGPLNSFFPGDPCMQFMGNVSSALVGGSEDWYVPQSTGRWRPTTKRCVTTGDGASPNEGVLVVYGPAFGLANRGYVMYEGSHDLDSKGTTPEKVAAQRIFFNYMFFAALTKSIKFTSVAVPASFASGETKNLAVALTAGNPPYTYQWTSSLAGGSFGSANGAASTYRAPSTGVLIKGVFTCKVTDACGRKNFINRPFVIDPNALPVSLTNFTVFANGNNKVQLTWSTSSEKENDYFTIERSTDGRHFSELFQVKGAGTTNQIKKYGWVDEKPFIGISYYRLKQTDFNGKSETFKTISVTIKAVSMSALKVYPNPISTSFTTEFDLEEDQTITMQLTSIDGKVVQTEKIRCTQGFNNFRFELNGSVSKGTYVLMLVNERTVFATQKVSIVE